MAHLGQSSILLADTLGLSRSRGTLSCWAVKTESERQLRCTWSTARFDSQTEVNRLPCNQINHICLAYQHFPWVRIRIWTYLQSLVDLGLFCHDVVVEVVLELVYQKLIEL